MNNDYTNAFDKSNGDVQFAASVTNTKTNKSVTYSIIDANEDELKHIIKEAIEQVK
ncbi:hypothetical protein [Paenibacillus taichungensis]|uniref:hypothetical protein n=1 Tax=Paenibacillus taichungensis TaxID=484184 RepID=UPI0039A3ABF5